jgi:tetratricopeptide (TPR) repeat protein
MFEEASLPDSLDMGGVRISPGDRIGSYVFVKPVGVGGMATVVLAKDPADEPVALKILKAHRMEGTGLPRFRREFRALSRIRHPNVIRVDMYGDVHGHPFIAMEYVEGTDLHHLIREMRFWHDTTKRWTRCEEILVDLCRALAHVHDKGLVHRDLKPSNILLDPQGRAKLTDFGIVKDLDPGESFKPGTLVGTWAYASPEQITGEPIDGRSDLYSLGILLFAMLTGCRPFDAKDMRGYREAHTKHVAPRVRDYEGKAPHHLDAICARLLQKRPQDRYQSAREILYLLEQQPSRQGDAAADWRPPLVGRGAERELIVESIRRLHIGEGGVLAVVGREGLGRSRLLEEANLTGVAMGLPVHRLLARPNRLFGLLDLCTQVQETLGERAPPALAQALTAFQAGKGRGDALAVLVDQVRPLLGQLAHERARVILLDDLDRVPPRGIEAIASLVRGLVAQGLPLLFVVSAKEGALRPDQERFLRGEGLGVTPRTLRLEPLGQHAVRQMVSKLVGEGDKSRALADRLFLETQGIPLYVSQFLQGLLQSGLIARGPRGFFLDADTEELRGGHLELPRGVQQAVRRRLKDLSPDALEVLQVLAAHEGLLELEVLLDVVERGEDHVMDQIDVLIGRGLATEQRSGRRVQHDVSHRLIGDVVYRLLPTEHRALLHGALADALEHHYADDPAALEEVGEHYRRAGRSGKAFRYLTEASERMRARALLQPAWDLSTRALALEDLARTDLGTDFPALRARLLTVRFRVLYVRAEWAECRRTCLALLRTAENHGLLEAAVPARATLARVMARLGETDVAMQQSDRALADARSTRKHPLVAEALYAKAALSWEAGDLAQVETLASEGLLLASGDSEVRGGLMVALAAVQAHQGQLALAARGLTDAGALFARLGKKANRCVALCNLAEMQVWQGRLEAARGTAVEGASLAREFHFRVGEATANRVLGEVLLELGDIEPARRTLEGALSEAGALGLGQEVVACRYALARLDARLGLADRAEAHLAIARSEALRGDPERYEPALIALHAWACALTGDHGDAARMLQAAERTLSGLPVPRRAQVLVGAARAHAAMGRREDAERLARASADLARSRGLRLLELESRLLLATLADRPGDRAAWTEDARALAAQLESELPDGWVERFRARPGLSDLA